jgi:hypothetical protein
MESSTGISSIVLKNVAEELQRNVTAEMNRFQQQIAALDSIIRYSSCSSSSSVKPVQEQSNDEMNKRFNDITTFVNTSINTHTENMNDFQKSLETFINKQLTTIIENNKSMSDYINNIESSIKKSFEVLTTAFNNQASVINELDGKYSSIESRLSAMAVNSIIQKESLDEMIQTNIVSNNPEDDIRELTAPPTTPESEPDIEEEEVHIEDTVEPDIEEENNNEKVEMKEEVEEEQEAEEQEEEEEAQEEEGEFDEVTYKGNTYYVDGDNIAYTVDDEGSLNEDPVGVWVPEKKIVRFYKK